MPSQSPMNGSTKARTRASERIAGGSHHFQAFQNGSRRASLAAITELRFLSRMSAVAGAIVVRGAWFNELSFDRQVRSFDHFHTITLRIVLNFVHDVVHQ